MHARQPASPQQGGGCRPDGSAMAARAARDGGEERGEEERGHDTTHDVW